MDNSAHTHSAEGDSSTHRRTGPFGGMLKSVEQLSVTLLGIIKTRLELLTTELQEEIDRATVLLIWGLVTFFAAGIGLFFAALTLIFVFWDTHRLLATLVVTGAFFAIAAFAWVMLLIHLRHRPRLLEGTLQELERDRNRLKARL
jgi:uncharacterized membrane protein YqjE